MALPSNSVKENSPTNGSGLGLFGSFAVAAGDAFVLAFCYKISMRLRILGQQVLPRGDGRPLGGILIRTARG